MSSAVVCVVTPCSLVSGYRRFGGRYRLHLQGTIFSSHLPPLWSEYCAQQPVHKSAQYVIFLMQKELYTHIYKARDKSIFVRLFWSSVLNWKKERYKILNRMNLILLFYCNSQMLRLRTGLQGICRAGPSLVFSSSYSTSSCSPLDVTDIIDKNWVVHSQ
jgi:hypothetical protein